MYLPISYAPLTTIAVVVFSSVLIVSLENHTSLFRIFTKPYVVYVGLISYSLYLWHWSVISISRWSVGIHWWSIPFQVAFMLGLAIASYHWVETPLRKGDWFTKRWKNFALASGILVTLSSIIISLLAPLKGKLYAGDHTSASFLADNRWRNDINAGGTRITGKNCHADSSYSKSELKDLFEGCKYQCSERLIISKQSHFLVIVIPFL